MHKRLAGLEDIAEIAAEIAASLAPGDVVALSGELGSGKTTFARALVRALHGRDDVSSPTFTFRHTYAGSPPVEHIDLYRLDDPAEARELGLEEALENGAIVLVEWPERWPAFVPERHLAVHFEGAGDAPREIEVRRMGASRAAR
ncbi:MAG: tRNA (adenosine(37)-N6)-threonylcarbamoyltransferase complex ATPase subunit type 1 TsaE [Candidatus Eremiobacteraeota bacterium]|nr:tRNA (adenosine(37)-N6)-threonylcarbamoyltransferase complex ATPase subunit type 1 TsaE [Candidatus Eremiobacteraeota bacterium]